MSTVQQLELEVVQPPPAPREHSHTRAQPNPVRPPQKPGAGKLLETPGALLTRSHLRALGLERRAVDAVFRALPVVALPGYSRPMIRAADYLQLVEQHTFRGDRVRPSARSLTTL